MRESSGSTTAWWWSLQFSGRASPSTTEEEVELERGRAAPGARVKLPCASPLYIGVEGAGFLPSKSIGALAKVGGKKSHHFLPHRLLSPLFRDLDLIPLGYDLIPSKGGSWCALTRGVGPFPHYPRSCGSPPCRWAPLRNLLEPSRYNTEKSRTFSGGQNRTSHI